MSTEAAQPNILLIVSEDNGPELGCYGDPFARTPHLDQLAAEGVRFENAFVPYSVCSPSRACFLTGLYAHQNGQIGLATHKFALYEKQTPNVVTLLKSAGYLTGLIGKLHVNPESAFPFDFQAIPGANFNRALNAEDYIAEAERFWNQAGKKPWFLSVNFPDAHLPFLRQAGGRPATVQTGSDVEMLPWVGADSPRLREVMADYYNCMARLDEWVGLLLESLKARGEMDNTLIIYIGDHGAQFPRGKGTVYEAGLRIPCIISWSGRTKPGTVRTELVSTVDLLPTILHAAEVEVPVHLSGRKLQPVFTDQKVNDWRKYIYAMTTGSFPGNCYLQFSIRSERFKLIHSPRAGEDNYIAHSYLNSAHPFFVEPGVRPHERAMVSRTVEEAYARWENPPEYELYDLQKDPYEWSDLAGDPAYANIKERLIESLYQFRHDTRDPFLDRSNLDAFMEEQLENRDMAYRKQEGFIWSYHDAFKVWRAQHP